MKISQERQRGFASTEYHLVLGTIIFLGVICFMVFPRVQSHQRAAEQMEVVESIRARVDAKISVDGLAAFPDRKSVIDQGVLMQEQLSTFWGPIGWRASTQEGLGCSSSASVACNAYTLEWEHLSKRFCVEFGAKGLSMGTHVQVGPEGFAGVGGKEGDKAPSAQIKKMTKACYNQDEPTLAITFPHPR